MTFEEIVRYRRSVRKYDPDKEIDAEKVKRCIELATLAPASSNMQLWEFYHITLRPVDPPMHRVATISLPQFIPHKTRMNTAR